MRKLTLATRGSALARAQAEEVRRALKDRGWPVELLVVETRGDRDRCRPLGEIGGDGLFVREVERALLSGQADLAVHSGKDLPYQLLDGLVVAGTPEAADPRDCLLTPAGRPLPEQGRVGTGSPRRRLECACLYPQAEFVEIRGNVPTRLDKLRRGECDGLILAKAGLDRLGIRDEDLDLRVFRPEEMLPAACQGILALECRESDAEVIAALRDCTHGDTWRRFLVERELFGALRTDCSAAVAVYAEIAGDSVRLRAMLQGRRAEGTAPFSDYKNLCAALREQLLREP